MLDRLKNDIARLLMQQPGFRAVRIHDGAVEAIHAAGTFRVEVTRL